MDLITTHTNADFDALASLVAAKKIYPDSRLLLPGSQEEAVREFLSLAREQIEVLTEKECRFDDVDRLILVDTRQKTRIGSAAGLLDKVAEVHAYDHHPRMKGDAVCDLDVYEDVGATVSILVEIIKRKKIKLSYIEATLMLIAIYEETGSLTYRTTTKLDVDMAGFLLAHGASLEVVSSYLNRELNESELALLTRLINLTERITISGVHISFVSLDAASYEGELGVLIHKLMEIENIPALFVLIRMPHGRVDIIARSKLQSLDVNKVLSGFGGGGHPGAGSAKVQGCDMDGVKKGLIAALKNSIKVRLCAEDIMSKSIKILDVNERIDDARKFILKNRLSGMPVVEDGRIAGIITLVGINKALKSGLGHSRVKGYMDRKVVTVGPGTPLYAIQKIVSERDSGVIPVINRKKIVGVISRTDVLRNVHESLFLRPHRLKRTVVLNLSKKMAALLPRNIVCLLKKIGKTSNSEGCAAFIVGGMVRDLLLGEKNLDLDIVVEGSAIKLGSLLAKEMKAAIVIHKKFGTCSVYARDGLKIDLATARKEFYDKPAVLPTVEFGSLKDDLIRRDFTMNAMAVSLNKNSFGQLIDFFGGERDLIRGRIKVLHDDSFIDDPTRIFRAVRFESRFGFNIEGRTEELIKNAIDQSLFDKVEPQRIRDELVLILKEAHPAGALKRMAELEELRFIHPDLKLDTDMMRLFGVIDNIAGRYERASDTGPSGYVKRPPEKWLIYIMALFDDLSYNTVSSICGRFVFRGSDARRILLCKSRSARALKALSAGRFMAPSRICHLLNPLSLEAVLFIAAKAAVSDSPAESKVIVSRVMDFLLKHKLVRISVTGEYIKKLGLKPSPVFKTILNKVLRDKIDGKLKSGQDELSCVRRLVNRRTEKI